jgi:hypothetical protein
MIRDRALILAIALGIVVWSGLDRIAQVIRP